MKTEARRKTRFRAIFGRHRELVPGDRVRARLFRGDEDARHFAVALPCRAPLGRNWSAAARMRPAAPSPEATSRPIEVPNQTIYRKKSAGSARSSPMPCFSGGVNAAAQYRWL